MPFRYFLLPILKDASLHALQNALPSIYSCPEIYVIRFDSIEFIKLAQELAVVKTCLATTGLVLVISSVKKMFR